MRLVVLLCVGSLLGGCQPEPCVLLGEYELFARRGQVWSGADGGLLACPLELQGTLTVRSASAAHFSFDGGLEGDCRVSTDDFRPRYACQVSLTCSSPSGVSFETFSFVGPERTELIDGFVGTPDVKDPLSFRANGCAVDYVWAAALRSAP